MTRVVLFGVDQMILPLTERLMEERDYPNLERVLHGDGAVAEAIPCWPAWTPTNWATIATGADPGAHGVFSWEVPLPDGRSLTSFHSSAIRADTLWEAADRAGLKVGLVHYPASWPSRLEHGFVIDGCALPDYGQTPFEIASGRAYSTDSDLPITDRVDFTADGGWRDLSSDMDPLTGTLEIRAKATGDVGRIPFAITGDEAYDRIVLSPTCSEDDVLAAASVGEWTDWCVVRVGSLEGRTRFRLLRCDPGSGNFQLWRSQVLPLVGPSEPAWILEDLTLRLGPYQEHVSEIPALGRAADYTTVADEARYQMRWFAKAMVELLDRHGCSLVGFHWHWLDWVNHLHLGHVDPAWSQYRPGAEREHLEVIHDAVEMIDEGLGIVLDGLGEEDLLILLADHGNLPVDRMINFRRYFVNTGRTVLLDPQGRIDESNTDWDRTRVYVPDRLNAPEIRLSPAVRDEDVQSVLADVIYDLRTLIDPDTGKTPVALALPKREAAILGWYGPDSGDIMVILEAGYVWDVEAHIDAEIIDAAIESDVAPHWHGQGPSPVFSDHPPPETAAHGHVLPTASTSVSSNMAILAMIGGPAARGYRRDPEKLGPAWLKDIAPTIAHLLGIEPPRHSSGGVLYDFLGRDPGLMERTSDTPHHYQVPRDLEDAQVGMYDFSMLEAGRVADRRSD